jgi:hypothetical protein
MSPASMETPDLMREYQDMRRAGWGLFGGNADRRAAELAAELRGRGVTHIPNIFGPIPIHGRPTPRP